MIGQNKSLCCSCLYKQWEILNCPAEERKEKTRCRLGLMKGSMIMVVEIQTTYSGHFVLLAPYKFIRISDTGT